MIMFSKAVLVTIACVFAAGAASAAGHPVTADEFTTTHVGKCIVYDGPSHGTQCYGADGTTSYDDTTYGKDTGQWKIDGDKVCANWKNDPGWDCGSMTRDGDVFSDGEYTWTIK